MEKWNNLLPCFKNGIISFLVNVINIDKEGDYFEK